MSTKSYSGDDPIDDRGNVRDASADAIYEQREWLRVTLESIGDAVITTGIDGKITFLNPVAQDLTGWSTLEARGTPLDQVFRIVNEETRLPVENPADRAFREGVVVGLANHTFLIAKDGTERPIDDSAAPIRNAAGEVAGVVLVFRDITERRRQELEIKDSLAFSQNIIATLREPFLVLDKSLIIKTANSAFYHTFQVTKEQTEGRFVHELGDGEWNIPRLRILLDDVLADHHPIENFEVEHDFKALGTRTMLLNASRFTSIDSGPELILLAIEDVTERKRAEEQLRNSEIKYRRLFQTAKDGILILDSASGKIIDSNPFMSGLLGYEHDEFLGKELWEIGLFQDVEANRAAYEELKQNGYIRYDHLPLLSKNGRRSEVEFVSNIYQMDHHDVVQCNIRDITERTRLERETREQAAALADLHRRKDEFLAMLSHELRNPLSPILNAVHLLRLQQGENLIQKEARGIIERQVGQLTRLVDDLLEVSRITTGRIRLHIDRLDMRIIVDRAVESARPLIDRRRHELMVSSPDDPIWIQADPTRMEQVVVNILNNAAKYTEEEGTIWLSVEQEGNEMVLRVRDTGVGIASELLPHVFDLFTQARRSLDRAEGGLGIGLSLVKHLVEMHRGKVEAQSDGIGRGTEFTVRLPVSSNSTSRSDAHHTKHDDHATTGLRVLVVDDNVDSTDILAKLLRFSGHNVRTAYAGPSALDIAASYLPEVVLLDIGLPGINGYEVARRLRLLPDLKKVKIVAMTGYGQDSDIRLAQESGFDSHMTKPVDFVKVLAVLSSYVSEAG